jgi:hypothetical protein
VTASISGTPDELKALVEALAPALPALEPLRSVELQDGHLDLGLSLPKVGNVVARITVEVTANG